MFSLAARIMWRLDKEGGVISELQLTTLDDLEDHISDLPEIDLKELKVDIHNFLDYWPKTSKQHTADSISHIFGLVSTNVNIRFSNGHLFFIFIPYYIKNNNTLANTKPVLH